jgi:hypothetical protein
MVIFTFTKLSSMEKSNIPTEPGQCAARNNTNKPESERKIGFAHPQTLGCAETPSPASSRRGKNGGNRGENLFIRAAAGDRACFGTLRIPIFRRKRHAPESWAGRREFQTDFSFARANRTEKDNLAFLFVLGTVVPHKDLAAAGDAGMQQNQSAVGVNGERFGLFLEGCSLSIVSANSNSYLHQHTLAATASYRIRGWTWCL